MEYKNLQDNIYPEEFNDRAQGIVNWIKENREKEEWAKDPNAYEMTNIFLLGAKYASEGEDINKQTLKEMWDIRSQDFAHLGISENNFVYRICEDSYKASQEGRTLVNDEASHHALRKMAGIGLFLSQQKAKGEKVKYDNASEFLELVETSKTLSGVHPDLFAKYGFDKNLQTIIKILPESNLTPRIEKVMNEIFEENSKEEKPNQEKDKVKERE